MKDFFRGLLRKLSKAIGSKMYWPRVCSGLKWCQEIAQHEVAKTAAIK